MSNLISCPHCGYPNDDVRFTCRRCKEWLRPVTLETLGLLAERLQEEVRELKVERLGKEQE